MCLAAGRAQGRLGILCYTRCFQDQKNKKRYVNDRSGYWTPVGGELSVLDGSQVVGFKRSFRFVLLEQGQENPRWEMTEYTIHSSKSRENKVITVGIDARFL